MRPITIYSTLLFYFSLILIAPVSVYAQPGTIKGKVLDKKVKEEMIGVTVVIDGTTQGAATDIEGNFTINNVKPGTYTLVASFISYKTLRIPNVTVGQGSILKLVIELEEDIAELEGVVIIGQRNTETEASVVAEIKEAEQVVSGISAEQITKSQDRDAAQVMRRIPGITIINDRFVMTRGLNERYNQVMLNGAIAPSTEPETRAFSFDIIPSSLIDRLLVFKSGSPENPGDFAGSVIKVYTKNQSDKNSQSLSLSGGYRVGTTFNEFRTYQGGGTDFLGFDDGTRSLPSSAGSRVPVIDNNDPVGSLFRIADISRNFENNWRILDGSALPDLRLSYSINRSFDIGKIKLSNTTNLSYSNSNQFFIAKRYRYETYALDNTSLNTFEYDDNQYSNNVRIGVLFNWIAQINETFKIEFKNMFNQLGNKETVLRSGVDFSQGAERRNVSLRYLSRGILSSQLIFNKSLNDFKTNLNFLVGYANTNRNEPDWRRARSQRSLGSNDPFTVVLPGSATTFDAARFYSELNEQAISNSFDFEHIFGESAEESKVKIRSGYYFENKVRSFSARWISYKALTSNLDQTFLNQGFEDIFSNNNIYFSGDNLSPSGLGLEEGTNPTDKYDAENLLLAGYASGFYQIGNVNMTGGIRLEHNIQQLRSSRNDGSLVRVNNPITSPLPFLNISYNFNEKNLIRAAYSRTVNRPEFRELAPFQFYDFGFDADIAGNPSLRIANIDNVDLRFEAYPAAGQTYSIGVFYKNFDTPIEQYIVQGTSNPTFDFRNAISAVSYGAEFEVRRSLYQYFENSPFLRNLSVLLNTTLIQSEVDLGDAAVNQARRRPLQGQSPYVINAGIYYQDEKDLSVSILYNIYGRRIFSVGDDQTRTIFELPRHILDLTISKQLNSRWKLNFGIADILNAPFILREDGDFDNRVQNSLVDKPILEFRRGQYITAGVTATF